MLIDPKELNCDHPKALLALRYADEAHASVGQVRGYTEEPYIHHPVSVTNRLIAYFEEVGEEVDLNMVCAALLHDVLEDTCTEAHTKEARMRDIVELFGTDVLSLVIDLTDPLTSADGNREFRVNAERERLSKIQPRAQVIKCMDMTDNCESIVRYDPNFARIYIREKSRALVEMQETGDTAKAIAMLEVIRAQERLAAIDSEKEAIRQGWETRWPWPVGEHHGKVDRRHDAAK